MTDLPSTRSEVPDPEDPDFIAKYTMPAAIREYAFGPSGGTPPPRVTRPTGRGKTKSSARTPPTGQAGSPGPTARNRTPSHHKESDSP